MSHEFTVEAVELTAGHIWDHTTDCHPAHLENLRCVATMLHAYAATLRQQAARVDEVEAKARELHEAYRADNPDARMVSWDQQWEPTREHWREKARAALSAQPAPRMGAPAWPGQLDGAPPPDGWVRMQSEQPAPERQGENSLYVEARQCEDCDHLGINDCSDTNSACGDCEWQGPTPDEDKCPGCGHENCMAVACPECGGRYRFLTDRRLAHPAAPAGVPDGDVRLWDTQWMNIVNHDNCYRGWDKDEAIAHAVKMTEQAIARNVADGKLPPPRIAAAPSEPQGTQQGEVCHG